MVCWADCCSQVRGECAYLREFMKLNENTCQEWHILLYTVQSLAKLEGIRLFSKLNANFGSWQIKLSKYTLAHYILHTILAVLFQSAPIWNHACCTVLSEAHIHNSGRIGGRETWGTQYWCMGRPKQNTTRDCRLFSTNSSNQLNVDKCEFSKVVSFLGTGYGWRKNSSLPRQIGNS